MFLKILDGNFLLKIKILRVFDWVVYIVMKIGIIWWRLWFCIRMICNLLRVFCFLNLLNCIFIRGKFFIV